MKDREQRIRERAYALWQREGRPDGREREHWQTATREIDSESGSGSDAAGTTPAAGAPAPGGSPRAGEGGTGDRAIAGEGGAEGKASGSASKKMTGAGAKKPAAKDKGSGTAKPAGAAGETSPARARRKKSDT